MGTNLSKDRAGVPGDTVVHDLATDSVNISGGTTLASFSPLLCLEVEVSHRGLLHPTILTESGTRLLFSWGG